MSYRLIPCLVLVMSSCGGREVPLDDQSPGLRGTAKAIVEAQFAQGLVNVLFAEDRLPAQGFESAL